MHNRIIASAAFVLATGSVGALPAIAVEKDHSKFEHAEAIIHHNATDGDAEVTFIVKTQSFGVTELTITDPTGRTVGTFTASKAVPNANGRAFEIESTERDLSQLLSSFPEGVYQLHGRDTEGTAVTGTAFLSHVLPSTVERLNPKDVATLVGGGVVRWSPVPGAAMYIIKIENEEIKLKYQAELPSSITSLTVPADWVSSEGEYTLDLGVVNKFGNLREVQESFDVQ